VLDYLVIGHVTEDIVGAGRQLGGTAAYAAVTAHALGLRVGVVTAAAETTSLAALEPMSLHRVASTCTTTFENRYEGGRRVQTLHALARPLTLADVPHDWRAARIVHLAPVAQEVDASLVHAFRGSLVGLTPQGWMRRWDGHDLTGGPFAAVPVRRCVWPNADEMLTAASAAIVSQDDIGGDFRLVERWARPQRPIVVTQGEEGATVFWRGERRRFAARRVEVVDPTGAGDVFAACFLVRLMRTGDAWSAAAAATDLATQSVTTSGVNTTARPTPNTQTATPHRHSSSNST
jgi:sugar/nucleoside kinase (ribokinase family)